jgi:hypothetical protein
MGRLKVARNHHSKPREYRPNNHSWTEVGVDPETNIANIWRCRFCGMYKAASSTSINLRPLKGVRVEFSENDGEVIGVNIPTPICDRMNSKVEGSESTYVGY